MIKKNKIKIKVNGKNYLVNNNYSLNELINKLDIPKKMVAIELNKKIVDKKKLKKIILKQFKLQRPSQMLFSFYNQNKLIGYGGLVHINWIHKNAEISFLLKPATAISIK